MSKISLGISWLAACLLLAGCVERAARTSKESILNSGRVVVYAPAGAVAVSWTGSREHDVNAAGGGYRVYYSSTPNFSLTGASYVDVPYVSGAAAPTTATITGFAVGNHFVKVVAYSPFSTSSPSAEMIVVAQ
jgi:hypothetical protein